jgi:hypothetical protein
VQAAACTPSILCGAETQQLTVFGQKFANEVGGFEGAVASTVPKETTQASVRLG